MEKLFVLFSLSILVMSSCDLAQKDAQEANHNPPVDSLNQSPTEAALDNQEDYPSEVSNQSSSNGNNNVQIDKRDDNKVESINGKYFYTDYSAELDYTIYGDSWRSKLTIKTGFGSDYDNQNAIYGSGIVVGNELYDENGFFVLGRVEQNRLVTSVSGQRVILEKQ